MKNINEKFDELIEELADIEHQRWADWQLYLHSKLIYNEYKDGKKTIACYIMDAGDYERWSRQIDTGYDELSEKGKDSDREQVRRYLPLIKHFYQTEITNLIKEMVGERRKQSWKGWDKVFALGYNKKRQEILKIAQKHGYNVK